MDAADIFMRMGLATGAGLLLGLDRELRGIAAGLRTHAMISMSSAMITISALMIYFQLDVDGSNIDPLRVIQGLAQAFGFVAAGAVFVAGNKVHNLTSATTTPQPARLPPHLGALTPVVEGKVSGRPRRLRTARKAKACASRNPLDQSTASASVTCACNSRRSVSSRALLRAPPPATIHRAGFSRA
jgi:putative Mg2+ transporter-C (MgtC) family protein